MAKITTKRAHPRLYKKISGQLGSGPSADVLYDLRLETTDGSDIQLADGIQGEVDAQRLLTFLTERLPQGEKTTSHKPRPAMPPWLPIVIGVAKISGPILAILVFGAFFYDFLKL